MRTMTPIGILRRDVANTIKRPGFLESNTVTGLSINDILWDKIYDILFISLDCVSRNILNKMSIDKIISKIDIIAQDIDNIATSKQLLYVWIFIHTTIKLWLDMALEVECYESASNIKKIIDVIYNSSLLDLE